MKMQIDFQLHDYLVKFLNRVEAKGQEYREIAISLIVVCERETHYEETREKIRKLLTRENSVLMPSQLGDLQYRPIVHQSQIKQGISEISILEQMIDLIQ